MVFREQVNTEQKELFANQPFSGKDYYDDDSGNNRGLAEKADEEEEEEETRRQRVLKLLYFSCCPTSLVGCSLHEEDCGVIVLAGRAAVSLCVQVTVHILETFHHFFGTFLPPPLLRRVFKWP